MMDLGDGGPPERIPRPPAPSVSYDELADGELIGQGGNADVYRVTVTRDGREIPVAVKQPRLQGTMHPETVERFVEEAEVWEQLDDYDHVVSLFDRGTEPLPWLAMEYMDGGSLETVLADGPLAPAQAAWVGVCVCRAVRHAHRHGVAHHDIKPANVLFRAVEDGWMVPKVTDWGLARMLLEETGSIEGLSPHYAAPEQFDPDTHGSPDDYTDIYQVGVLVYELFTGRVPFEGPPATVMQGVLNEGPAPPSAVADVPPELDGLLQPALAKEKSDRYDSVLYLRDELQALFEQLPKSESPTEGTTASGQSTPSRGRGPRHTDRAVRESRTQQEQPGVDAPRDNQIYEIKANYTQSESRSTGGTLILSENSLFFEPHAIAKLGGGEETEVSYDEIQDLGREKKFSRGVKETLFGGGLRDRLRIETNDGGEYLFVVSDIDDVINKIRELTQSKQVRHQSGNE